MSEREIRDYIKRSIPGVSYESMWKIRCMFVYENIDLDEAIEKYKQSS